ncbi:unnamed protein product, partial [Trichogramma brassicae]
MNGVLAKVNLKSGSPEDTHVNDSEASVRHEILRLPATCSKKPSNLDEFSGITTKSSVQDYEYERCEKKFGRRSNSRKYYRLLQVHQSVDN